MQKISRYCPFKGLSQRTKDGSNCADSTVAQSVFSVCKQRTKPQKQKLSPEQQGSIVITNE
jgi:hypothetical protein